MGWYLQDLWILILALWLPVAGVVVALCVYDLTGGDGEVWPRPRRPRPTDGVGPADAVYRDPLDRDEASEP